MALISARAPVFAARVGSSRQPLCVNRSLYAAPGRTALRVVAFRDNQRTASGVTKAAEKKVAGKSSGKSTMADRGIGKGNSSRQSSGSSSSAKGGKKRTVLAPRAPRNERENKESVVTFMAVAILFLTGVLFVFPALLGGSPATTKPIQQGINKTFGIEDNSDAASVRGKPYAPGPGPAAAPGTAAAEM